MSVRRLRLVPPGAPGATGEPAGDPDAAAAEGDAADPQVSAALELQLAGDRSWPAPENGHVGGWLLRAAEGWTRRANSALPAGDPGCDIDTALARVVRWYAARGLPARLLVPLPALERLFIEVVRRGWRVEAGAMVLVAGCTDLLAHLPAAGLPAPVWEEQPGPAWLACYRPEDGPLPAAAVRVLAGGGARFASMREGERTVAITRCVLDGDRVGISAVEVSPERRREGLATHLLRHVVAWALEQGAGEAWLQVAPDNAAALALYERAGFRLHHEYQYLVAAGTGGVA